MKTLVQYINERKLGDGWKTVKENGYVAYILAFEESSQYGIDGGKISKLEIRKDDELVCRYERGWDVKPTEEVKTFYNKIIKQYN